MNNDMKMNKKMDKKMPVHKGGMPSEMTPMPKKSMPMAPSKKMGC